MASEAARADIKAERRFWIDRRQPRMRHEPHRLVFVDETSVTTKMVRLRGRAPRGERLLADARSAIGGADVHRRPALQRADGTLGDRQAH
jgi:hypothetical protein